MALSFEDAQAQAITDHTCFCMCGCRDSAPAVSILGTPVPGLCDRCNGKAKHERIATYAMYDAFINPLFEDEVVEPLPPAVDPGPIMVPILASGPVDTAEKRLTIDHYVEGHEADLTSLHIPATVPDGTYKVRSGQDVVQVDIERPTSGRARGWVIVKMTLPDGVIHYGVQQPRLFRKPRYKGWFPQLVAKVVEGVTNGGPDGRAGSAAAGRV